MDPFTHFFNRDEPSQPPAQHKTVQQVLARLDIPSYYDRINATANQFLNLLGPHFTNTPEGHIATDIAASASVAGHMLLRRQGFDLSKIELGTVVISDVYLEQETVWRFMINAAYSMGLDSQIGWDGVWPAEHAPLMDTPELLRRLLPEFLSLCEQSGLAESYYPFVAALAAVKLVSAGHNLQLLDAAVGKALALYYLIAGSKTASG